MNNIIILGSGDTLGTPVVGCSCKVCSSLDNHDKRTRFGIYICYENFHILIDTNPDLKQQFLHNKLDFKNIDCILLTHTHSDHINGMGELSMRKPIQLYHGNHLLTLKHIEYFKYLERENVLKFNTFDDNEKIELTGNINFETIALNHGFPTWGFIIRLGDKKIGIISDTNIEIEKEQLEKFEGCDILFVDGFSENISQVKMLYEQIGEEIPEDLRTNWYHMTFNDIAELKKILKPKEIFVIHISHIAGHHEYLKTKYNDLNIGFDGLNISI